MLDPTVSDNPVAFTIQPAASLQVPTSRGSTCACTSTGQRSTRVRRAVRQVVGRRSVLHGERQQGRSRISVDDPTFAHAVPARIGASGSTWSVAIPTPAVGKHTIYAESTQGFDSRRPASTTFTVKR